MKLPRDLAGVELASLLGRFGYEATRQTGSHIRLTSRLHGTEHHVTIPRHKDLRVGTLASILTEVAAYLDRERDAVAEELFGR